MLQHTVLFSPKGNAMGLAEDTAYVGRLLDAYGVGAGRIACALIDPEDEGVPPDMQVGEVDAEGWVEWRLLPSTLTEPEVTAVEEEFAIRFPALFRAYLLARFHLFSQVMSRRHGQQILMSHTPSHRPLEPLRSLMRAWEPLTTAGYIPFAEWGDGWGPMCFDAARRSGDGDCEGDCPIVWIDHERLVALGESGCGRRDAVSPLAQPLYPSFQEFLTDVFPPPPVTS